MGLVREASIRYLGFKVGDMKIAHYSISYTSGQVVKPTQDPLWILLNGASLATATYPALFALYGYTFGGSGANFTLPNLTEGRTPITKGLTNFPTIGVAGGEINHVLTSTEMLSHTHGHTLSFAASPHNHSVSASLNSADSHSHAAVSAGAADDVSSAIGTSPYTVDIDGGSNHTTTGSAGAHSHSGSLSVNSSNSSISTNGGVSNNTGGNGSHNNMQPYIVIGGWLVKFG